MINQYELFMLASFVACAYVCSFRSSWSIIVLDYYRLRSN